MSPPLCIEGRHNYNCVNNVFSEIICTWRKSEKLISMINNSSCRDNFPDPSRNSEKNIRLLLKLHNNVSIIKIVKIIS